MSKSLLLASLFFLIFSSRTFSQSFHLVKDLNPGAANSFSTGQTGIKTTLGDVAIFVVSTGSNANQLMRSDGTEDGTYPLLPAYDPELVTLSGFVVKDDLCWFLKYTADSGSVLYASDGTVDGTKIRHQSTTEFSRLTPFKDGFLMKEIAGDFDNERLWRFFPADSTQILVGSFYWFGGLRDFTVTGSDTIYAIGSASGSRNLYKSDGSIFSMQLVKEINTGSEANSFIYMTPVGDKVYFFWQKTDTDDPYKLWVSNGTAAGTVGLKEFDLPIFGDLRQERALLVFNDKLYFRGKSPADGKGYELYTSNGTVAGTKIVKDANAGLADGDPQNLSIFEGKIWYESLDNLYNQRLWSSNGTTASVQLSDYTVSGVNTFQDSLVMSIFSSAEGSEVVFTKGTVASTRVISNYNAPGTSNFYSSSFAEAAHKMYSVTRDAGGSGIELWVYEPATSGSHDIQDPFQAYLNPNPAGDYVQLTAEQVNYLRVFDFQGRLMTAVPFAGQQRLDIAAWPAGTYTAVLSGDTGYTTQVFVKVK